VEEENNNSGKRIQLAGVCLGIRRIRVDYY